MADKELVIRLDEETYDVICECQWFGKLYLNTLRKICDAVKSAMPLPKGHGRLIDAKEYENSIRKHYFDNRTVIRCTEIALENAPTIIEADKGEE